MNGMNTIRKIAMALVLPFLLTGCVREVWPEADGDFVLRFNADSPTDVVVSTKSTLSESAEMVVHNMYVFIFEPGSSNNAPDNTRKKIYGQFFDDSNKGASGHSTEPDWWEAAGNSTNSGTVHIKTPNRGDDGLNGCTVIVISNINEKMINISRERLDMVQTLEDARKLDATLLQMTSSRNGFFPMSAEVTLDKVKLETSPVTNITLRRLDAKIAFNVQVEMPLENGNLTKDPISSFTPLKWRVVHLPKKSYVLPRDGANREDKIDAATKEEDFFDWGETNFESETQSGNYYYEYKIDTGTGLPTTETQITDKKIPVHGFSFYMMENRKDPKTKSDWIYADREAQDKNEDLTNKSGFLYAPDLATYVVITGRVEMKNYQGTNSTLSAEVQYIVHLGDFGDGTNPDKYKDFDVNRNYSYTYNIYLRGVEDIRVEVQGKDDGTGQMVYPEKEPGATGTITVSKETVLECDAHYYSHVLDFYADRLDNDYLKWRVQTPFNPDGAGPEDGKVDSDWVEFRLNDKVGDNYSDKRTLYYPRTHATEGAGTMTIDELVEFLKKQKSLYDNQGAHLFDASGKISVTAFVNEFYYTVHPITGKYDQDLWRKFVNQPMRYMCILSKTEKSPDGESRVIGASYTIRQHSIQSVYNVNSPSISSAWGGEYLVDENEEEFDMTGKPGTRYSDEKTTNPNRGNNDVKNGRFNSMKEWGLIDKNGGSSIMGREGIQDSSDGKKRWDDFLDLTATNTVPILKVDKQYPRYSCLSRNRDNDGDGVIDEEEIRWYMASSNQLIELFVGGFGIDGAARLYQRSAADRMGDKWRQHVLASDCVEGNSNYKPRNIWAEEGLNGSDLSKDTSGNKYYSARCLRNLGGFTSSGESKDITWALLNQDGQVKPDELIIRERKIEPGGSDFADVYYEFDCSRLNKASIRYYTDQDLPKHNEFEEASSLYLKFRTATNTEMNTCTYPSGDKAIADVNKYLDEHPGDNPFCPKGYRFANVRESGLIWYFANEFGSAELDKIYNKSNNSGFSLTRTYWSLGWISAGGSGKGDGWGWGASYMKLLMAGGSQKINSSHKNRCVKDIKVE